jgi:predicted PurR-regulated permease PerM
LARLAWRIAWRGILLFFSLVLLALLARELQSVIVQLLLAVLLAASASPEVDRLTSSPQVQHRRWRPGRGPAAAAVFLAGVLLLVLGSVLMVATVAPDLSGLAASLPGYAVRFQRFLDDLVTGNPELASLGAPPGGGARPPLRVTATIC